MNEHSSANDLPENMTFLDTEPTTEDLREHVLQGLGSSPKFLASKFLYDERGSELFDQICQQPEYYQTNAELEILDQRGESMLPAKGREILIEFGSGNNIKIQKLLGYLRPGSVYVPLDISRDYLRQQAAHMAKLYPHLHIAAVCADFLQPLQMPIEMRDDDHVTVFFPGSTIGNFEPATQQQILANLRDAIGPHGQILIGVDRKNDQAVLEAAYNDAAGVTAAFELNILNRLNQELGANFQMDQFHYKGFYNGDVGRIEMHLVSKTAQKVTVDGSEFSFAEGEWMHVENSYKYAPQEFQDFVAKVDLQVIDYWSDAEEKFSVYRLGR